MLSQIVNVGCDKLNHDKLSITATNGRVYSACIHYTLTGALNTVKIYDWPDRILFTDGYLKKILGALNSYEFISTVGGTGGGTGTGTGTGTGSDYEKEIGGDTNTQSKNGKGSNANGQWIPGIDNMLLIGIGLVLFLIMNKD